MNLISLLREIKSMPPQIRCRAIIVEYLLRFYCLTMGFIYALFESASWSIFWKILLICLSADIIRNFLAPELRQSPGKLYALIDRLQGEESYKRRWLIFERIGLGFIGLYILFVVGLIFYSPPNEAAPLSASVRLLQPYQNFFAQISHPVRSLPADLIAHGYPNRAAVTSAMAIVSTSVFIIYMAYVVLGLGYYRGIYSLESVIKKGKIKSSKTYKGILNSLGVLWLSYLFVSNFESVQWIDPDPFQDWDIYENNQPFIWYAWGIVCSLIGTLLFAALIKDREKIFTNVDLNNFQTSQITSSNLQLRRFHDHH